MISQLKFDLLTIALVFAVSFLMERYILPKILLISKKKRLFDIPDNRKEHKIATPRLAGVSFIPVLLFSFLLVFSIRVWYICKGQFLLGVSAEEIDRVLPQARALMDFLVELCMLICGMILLLLLGIKDDLIGVKFSTKFMVQFFAALCFTFGGVYFYGVSGVLGVVDLPIWVSIPFSIFVIMLITNSINLIDGIDGLASGLSIVAVFAMGVSFFQRGFVFQSMLAFSALGVLIPFFIVNVFKGQERKLFMGDTGSLALGFLLGYLAIRHSLIVPGETLEMRPLLLPISVLFIPAFDVARVMLARKMQGKPLFMPDRNHIHHKLIDAGFSRRHAMILIVCSSVLLLFVNMLLSLFLDINIILVLDVVFGILSIVFVDQRIKRRARAIAAENKP